MNVPSLQNRLALVTGSVQGIGLAMAQELARAGAQVVLHGLANEAVLAAARTTLSARTLCGSVSRPHTT